MSIQFLEKPEDFHNWNKLIEHCDVLEELTNLQKEQAKRAFLFLRHELGEDFLYSEPTHPLNGYITNTAPWTRQWIIWFSEALKELRDQENYFSLLARLKDGDKFKEAESVLEIGYKFSKAGFKVTVDPEIAGYSKIPDLKLNNPSTNEDLFVEISVINQSKKSKEAYITSKNIFDNIWPIARSVYYSGRIHKILAEKHLDDVSNKVKKVVEITIKENRFHELIIDDVIELGVAPENDKLFLEQWATARNLKLGEFSGPSYNVDEVSRIDNRFDVEQRQLPANYPNILIVRNSNLLPIDDSEAKNTISKLEEIVYKYPHLLVGIISGEHLGISKDRRITKDQNIFIEQSKAGLIVDTFFVLLNKYCDFKVSPSTISKIYESCRIN